MGYAPYAAGLYTNNRFGITWLVILGAALCGISAGVFWAVEAAIAIAYPEPWNRGKSLGFWLTFRVMGQIIGGAVNLGLNSSRNEAGKVSYAVYLVFIAIQAAGALVALLLNRPQHVQRQDGKKVQLSITETPWYEIKATAKAFVNPQFLLIVLWIGQAVFSEAVYFTYLSRKSLHDISNFGLLLIVYFSVVFRSSSSSRLIFGWRRCHYHWQPHWRMLNQVKLSLNP